MRLRGDVGRCRPVWGVAAAATNRTCATPAALSARPAAWSVPPVVMTSSTTSTRTSGRTGRARNAGPSAANRWARLRPVCGAPWERYSIRLHGTPSCRATSRASSSAWSNPRSRRCDELVGAHVTTSKERVPRPPRCRRLTMSVAKCFATGRLLRNFSDRIALRATPSNESAATIPPGTPGPAGPAGWATDVLDASENRHGRHRTGPCWPQHAHRWEKIWVIDMPAVSQRGVA